MNSVTFVEFEVMIDLSDRGLLIVILLQVKVI